MPARDNPWAVYDVFTVKDGEQIFLAAVSDAQWRTFCDALGLCRPEGRPGAGDQQPARAQRPRLLKTIARAPRAPQRRRAGRADGEAGLPFAPIRKPEDLYDDPHLLATGGLADVRLPDGPKAGQTVKTTLFPITMDGAAPGRAAGSAAPGRAQPRAAGRGWASPTARSTSCWPEPSWPEPSIRHSWRQDHDHELLPFTPRRIARAGSSSAGAAGLSPQPALRSRDRHRAIHPASGHRLRRGHDHARGAARRSRKALGHPVVVENQPGAGGVVGTAGARQVAARRLHA